MAKPVVFVAGASGNIGKATINALSSNFGEKIDIRAGVRNPDKASALTLKSLPGVTVIQAEIGQKEKLNELFQAVDTLLIVSPGSLNRVEITVATAEAAKEAGVKHVAVISGTSAAAPEQLTFGKHFHAIETGVERLGVPYTFIRLSYFFENYLAQQASIKEKSEFYAAIDPNKTFSFVAADDAGIAAAAILVSPEKYAGKTYSIVSDRNTVANVAQAFSNTLSREVKYIQITYEQARAALTAKGAPSWQVDGILEYTQLINAGHPAVDLQNVNDFLEITGKKPTSVSAWITKFKGEFTD